MKASDLLVRCLENEGIEYIFGVPGEENADFMMSLHDSRRIRFVLTRHEQGAAFMAEVYGRLTGKPAVCLGTLGPGATNLITGVANANMDRVPMLVLTGQGASTRLHKESHQAMDVVAMFRPVTQWATSIRHADVIPEVVRKAVRIATRDMPGACHIELPEDIAKTSSSAQAIVPVPYHRAQVSDTALTEATALIRQAKRPVILAGNGCIRRGASAPLRAFCAATGIGVISTFMAKGCVDMDDDACLYTIGLQARDLVACAMEAADLVITVGYDLVEYPPKLWNAAGDKNILHLYALPAEIDEHYHPQLELVGNISNALHRLTDALQADTPPLSFDIKARDRVRHAMQLEFAEHADDTAQGCLKPQKVLWDVRQVMGPKDILLSDVGAHKMWIARHYQCHEPNTCLIPNGFCSMGFALPGAIAAALVHPDRHILSICGDAGFLMNVQEMETARRLNSAITVMVWEDHAYGLIAWKQDNAFGRHTELNFGNPDWMQLAQAFGWNGHTVTDSSALHTTLHTALAEPGPSLLVIPIDYRENAKLTERLGNIVCAI